MKQMRLPIVIVLALLALEASYSQAIERTRPPEWSQLVPGARFMDRFLPMPAGESSAETWGSENVVPRYVDNGIEDRINSYWGGNIIRGNDKKYHLFVCGWPENSPGGHAVWPGSTVYHTTSDNPVGPFKIKSTIGKGHNPEAFRLKDGRYVIYVIGGYYISDTLDGPWTMAQFTFNNRDRKIIEGLSNLTFARREDGSVLMVCRGGGIWISETGTSPYNQISDKSVYPPVEGAFEDPVVWRDHIQYHLIVNDWYGRIAYYQRSKDGVNWVTDPGEAYMPGIAVHADGSKEDWFKYERIKVLQDEHGRAIQANFAVIDVLKEKDQAGDNHSSKNIGIPLNPGLLLEVIDQGKISGNTLEINLKISAEEGFNPHTDLDIDSLRFGASSEVNFGRGCKVKKTAKSGKNLIVTFDGKGNGITEDEFAAKLLGKRSSGQMVYGYARLPEVNYNTPILSARKPVFPINEETKHIAIDVENFGQVPSLQTCMELFRIKDGKETLVASASVPALKPYEKKTVSLASKMKFEMGETADFRIIISEKKKRISTFDFTAAPHPWKR